MKNTAPESVRSGTPYEITAVAGHDATSLDEFAGETRFVIECLGERHEIYGQGALDGQSVRFYQKDECHEGKDVRVWRITAEGGRGFTAEHAAAI